MTLQGRPKRFRSVLHHLRKVIATEAKLELVLTVFVAVEDVESVIVVVEGLTSNIVLCQVSLDTLVHNRIDRRYFHH